MSTHADRTGARKVTRIHRAPHDANHPYTRVTNALIDDDSVSFAELGFMVWLLRKPDHWRLNRKHVARARGVGRREMERLFRVERRGYIRRIQCKTASGTFDAVEYEIVEDGSQETPVNGSLAPREQNVHAVQSTAESALPESRLEEVPMESEVAPRVRKPRSGKRTRIVNTDRRAKEKKRDSDFGGDSRTSPPSSSNQKEEVAAQAVLAAAVEPVPAGAPAEQPCGLPADAGGYAGEAAMDAVLAEARRLVASDHRAARIVAELEEAAGDDLRWALGTIKGAGARGIKNTAAFIQSKINERKESVRRERNHACGRYEPGEKVTVDGGDVHRRRDWAPAEPRNDRVGCVVGRSRPAHRPGARRAGRGAADYRRVRPRAVLFAGP